MAGVIYDWREKERDIKKSKENLDGFFDNLKNGKVVSPEGIQIAYRDGQNEFAKSVMNALEKNQILLIEAGVGIGKSFGYLIPIYYMMNNVVVFDKVIISTSTIALSSQLKKDVEKVSSMLNISIPTEISKGMNNYACIDAISRLKDKAYSLHNEKVLEVLNNVLKAIKDNHSCDKLDLPYVPNYIWNSIQVNGCTNCNKKSICEYNKIQEKLKESKIIITNHPQLANLAKENRGKLIDDASAVIIDEAHDLEEGLRLSSERVLNIRNIIDSLSTITKILNENNSVDTFFERMSIQDVAPKMVTALTNFIKALRSNAKKIYFNVNQGEKEVQPTTKLAIDLDKEYVKKSLYELIECYKQLIKIFKSKPTLPGINKNLKKILNSMEILCDMSKNTTSKNIYWVRYVTKSDIEIVYTPKSIDEELEKIYGKKRPIILTSGTMLTEKTYDNIEFRLNLSTSPRVEEHTSIPSPYDYAHNSLFYYDENVISPKSSNRVAYLDDIANKVENLIKITEGKALVLFTSRSDMNEVYERLIEKNIGINLILQDCDSYKCKKEFTQDENSCLFATGSFWEGMDISGKTLSNVIIVRLPFPVMDPIVEYKKAGMCREEAVKLTKDEMLMKLAQGTGRLIRSANDVGIVCTLDSRINDYLDSIKNTLPFVNYTTSLDDVKKFVDEKGIINSKTLKLEPLEK